MLKNTDLTITIADYALVIDMANRSCKPHIQRTEQVLLRPPRKIGMLYTQARVIT